MQANWEGYRLAARYEIQELLGEGGMSTVYRAFDHNLHRTVAVKMIHPHLATNPEFVQRFKTEAQAVAKLHHNHIMQVYDFANEGEVYYMVLEYIRGNTLKSVIKQINEQGKHLSSAESIKLLLPICEAVHFAHQHNMIHRDIKPGNIMLDSNARPILTDFGLARIVENSQNTRSGAIMGTALYMAPEQVRGEHATRSADIYALGVILYELLTGHPPYQGESLSDIMWMHVEAPIPDISQEIPDIHPDLKRIIERALAKSVDDRYASAQALWDDLQNVSSLISAETPSLSSAQPKTDTAQSTLIENALSSVALPPEEISSDSSKNNLKALVQKFTPSRQPRGLFHIAALESGLLSTIFSALFYIYHWDWAIWLAVSSWLVSTVIWLWAFPAWARLSSAYRLMLVKAEEDTHSEPPTLRSLRVPRLDYPHDIELMAAPAAFAALVLSGFAITLCLPNPSKMLIPLTALWVIIYLVTFFFNLHFLALNFLQPGVAERFHFGHFLQALTYGLIALPGMALAPLLSGWVADIALLLSLAAFVVGGILGALMVIFLFQRILNVGLPTPALSPMVFFIAPLITTYTLFTLFLMSYLLKHGVVLPPVFFRLIIFTALGLLLAGEGLATMLFIGYTRDKIPRTPLWWSLVDPFSGIAALSVIASFFGIQPAFFSVVATTTAVAGALFYLYIPWRLRKYLF